GGYEEGRLRLLRPPALLDERLHRRPAASKNRGALPTPPHTGRQERLERDGRPIQRLAEDRRIDRRGDRPTQRPLREGLLLGLEGQISDAQPGRRERALGPPRGRGAEAK